MKIIIVDRAYGPNSKGGYQARVYGIQPALQTFAKSEQEALAQLAEKILEVNSKKGLTGSGLYRIQKPK